MTSAPEGLAPPDPALLDPFVHALRAAAGAHLGRAAGVAGGGPGTAGALVAAPADLVDRAAEVVLLSCCDTAWQRGWLPAELLHQGRRSSSAPLGRLVAAAIANDHVERRSTTLHPAWAAHVDSLGLPPADGRAGWVTRWAAVTGLARLRTVALLVQAVARVSYLPPLDRLLPPPGATAVPVPSWYLLDTADAGGHPVLGRIRALLAKAESTTFEAEALALTAKAHELMAKHAVDSALVAGRAGGRSPLEQAVAMRLCIDAPYVDVKSTLLHVIAKASRGRVVQHPALALCTVVGHPADLQAIEVLYTSLLVQAQTALDDACRRGGPSAGGRLFRSSFLAAYAHRIGQRLEAVSRTVVAEATATHGAALVPVLASRAEAVDAFIDEHFADLRTLRSRRSIDPAGYASGRLAAERAHLAHGEVT
jgi:hypothetical protein